MKKKDIITIIIITAVLAATLFGAIFLTSRRGKSSDGKPINLYRPIWNEKIIYDHSGVYVVDSENSTIKDLPIDLSSFGINDFRKEALMAGNVDGINLYLSYSYYTSLSESKDMFFRYNLITSEISEIEFTTAFEMNSNHNFYAHGGYLYYFGWNTEDPVDAIINNYPSYLCRVPVSGGKEEVLAEYQEKSSAPFRYMMFEDREELRAFLQQSTGAEDLIVIMGARDNSLSDYAKSLVQM
jgi:hypothetical protein